jgi:LPS-assembly lipoprotein
MILIKPGGIKPKACARGRHPFAFRLLAMCSLAAMLSGCGFTLEGTGALPSAMTRTFLESPNRNSPFLSSLRDALRLRGSQLVDAPSQADAVLTVSADDTGQRVLSVSARNIPREYEIYYAVTIALRSGGTALMEPETIVVTRAYTYDETQVLGKSAEERLLREALADDLARQVLRRVETAAASGAVPIG